MNTDKKPASVGRVTPVRAVVATRTRAVSATRMQPKGNLNTGVNILFAKRRQCVLCPTMSTKKYLLAILFAALGFTALADDGGTNGDECQINGTEQMDAVVVLNATSNAPDGASGVAKIDSENDEGDEAAHVDVKTFGLDPGVYDLSVTLQSTGSNVDLGQFTVSPNDHNDDENEDGDGGNLQAVFGMDSQGGWIGCGWGGFTNWGCWTNWCDTNFVSAGVWAKWLGSSDDNTNCSGSNGPLVSRTEADLPPGVNPTDIAEIMVSDANGNLILDGSLVTPSQGTVVNISGTVQVTAGPGAPFVNGTAQVQSTAHKGKWQHKFTLTASGVNAKTTYKLDVNGKIAGGARSDKSGQMKIKRLPSHVPALRSLRLLDAEGNVAASAQF